MKSTFAVDETVSLTLDMSRREAEVLLYIMNYVSGRPGGPRDVVKSIISALFSGGVSCNAKYGRRGPSGQGIIHLRAEWPE